MEAEQANGDTHPSFKAKLSNKCSPSICNQCLTSCFRLNKSQLIEATSIIFPPTSKRSAVKLLLMHWDHVNDSQPIISSTFTISIKLSSISVRWPRAPVLVLCPLPHIGLIKLLTGLTHTVCDVLFHSAGRQDAAAPSITLTPLKDF